MERSKPLKRSPLKPPTIEQVRAYRARQREKARARELERAPTARKPIAKVGAKTKREAPSLRAFRQELRRRSGGRCEAFGLLRTDALLIEVCGEARPHRGVHPHHVWPEDHDRGVHDPERGLLLCWRAHEWTHMNSDRAGLLGLLRPDP